MHKRDISFIAGLFVIGAVLVGLLFFRQRRSNNKEAHCGLTVGIIQTATHPALDAAKKGFIDFLKEKMGDTITFIIRNGEGSSPALHTIAQQLHARKDIDALYAIATPSVQAAAAVEYTKPVIISAVTDPHQLGIMKTHSNISGASDMIDIEQEIRSMLVLVPSLKTVSVIYSPSEMNAALVAEEMEKALRQKGILPRLMPITSQAEVVAAVSAALAKADALIAPTDNLIASAITVIADLCRKARKPLIVSDTTLVPHGALMAQGVDYYENGRESGRIAYEVMVHKKLPAEIPVARSSSHLLVINEQIVDELGLSVPPSLASKAHFVGGR